MEYLIDKASCGVDGGPSDNVGSPPGGPLNKGDTSTSSSSSLSDGSLLTSKKNCEDIRSVLDLLKVIASQGVGGKDKTNQFSNYEDKIISNSKHEYLTDIPKDITL